MNFSQLLCKSASVRFLIKDETDSLKLKIELIWKGENQFWTIHVFFSQGRWIKAMALMKLVTGWELLVLMRPSQLPQESGCCRWLHSATMSAMILIKKTDMDPIKMRNSEKETLRDYSKVTLSLLQLPQDQKKTKQSPSRSFSCWRSRRYVRFCWRHNPGKQEHLSDALSCAASVEDSPGEWFWGRCAGRFQHKTMFISIISRLFGSKLLLAHGDSRWATSLW